MGIWKLPLFYIFISFFAFELQAQVAIYANDEHQFFDLRGRDGFDGTDGADAYPLICEEDTVSAGRQGDHGGNGENGENGQNASIYFADINELKKIELNQLGGKGGSPGIGGQGSYGCHGGMPGEEGNQGQAGRDGELGKIFFVPEYLEHIKANPKKVISLWDLYQNGATFLVHQWDKIKGAKALFHPNSKIDDYYYKYKQSKQIEVRLVWNFYGSISKYRDTRLALAIIDGELYVRSYSGALIEYKISREGNVFHLEILKVTHESELGHLKLGRFRGKGEKVTLEVEEKYRPQLNLETKFVITLTEVDAYASAGKTIGQFELDESEVMKSRKLYRLPIGALNFDPKYKKIGTRIKIQLSIYRKVKNQTRIIGLQGLFKI